ncbi:MAG TPA: TetR/AcrR family transcriptional regulator [Acidimicrobiales bacterium]|nr:TetR/AcrR family transcriptional regulator [Acidimicrobiales bacterium]
MRTEARTTRERILDTALDLFIEEGYDKASLRELAERMGFTKAALYYHFTSKADILMALHQRLHGLLEGPLASLGNGPVNLESFEKFLDTCIDEMQSNYKLFVLHRNNQAALREIHHEDHEGSHIELEERTRSLLSDRSLTPEARLRMTAAFALAFVSPLLSTFFSPPEGDKHPLTSSGQRARTSKGYAHPPAGSLFTTTTGISPEVVTGLKTLVAQVLRSDDRRGRPDDGERRPNERTGQPDRRRRRPNEPGAQPDERSGRRDRRAGAPHSPSR